MGELLNHLAVEEGGHHDRSAGRNASRLCERRRNVARVQMDERVPHQQTRHGPVTEREVAERADREALERSGSSRVIDERRSDVDSNRVDTPRREMGSEVAWAAPCIEYRLRFERQVLLDQVEVVGMDARCASEAIDVPIGDSGVRTRDLLHTAESRATPSRNHLDRAAERYSRPTSCQATVLVRHDRDATIDVESLQDSQPLDATVASPGLIVTLRRCFRS